MLQLLVTMGASAGLAMAGSAAFAKSPPHMRLRPIAQAFSVLGRAHLAAASAAPRESIAGAQSTTFAGSFSSGDTVFAATLSTGDVCVVDQEPAGPAGASPTNTSGITAVACSHPADAEASGVGLVVPSVNGSSARITLLVPDGVGTVTFAYANGTSTRQAVDDNVVQAAAPDLTSATFVNASGDTVSDSVASAAAAS